MSAVLYMVRIKKADFWSFVEKYRQFCIRTHFFRKEVLQGHRDYIEYEKSTSWKTTYTKLEKAFERHKDQTIELQLFEIQKGYYHIRPLEQFNTLWNNFDKEGWPVKPVVYDNRTEVPKEERKNKRIACKVDELIRQRKYLICSIVSAEDMHRWIWEDHKEEIKSLLFEVHELVYQPNATPPGWNLISDRDLQSTTLARKFLRNQKNFLDVLY